IMEEYLVSAPPYLDYSWLMERLKNYASPRSKITQLIAKGDIVRIKKGLYLPGQLYNKSYSRSVLANLIYGPSYISLEYALSYYGMTPERVECVTSITTKRNKYFETEVGNFSYAYMPEKIYSVGIILKNTDDGSFFLATKEKALCDMIYRQKSLSTQQDFHNYLFQDLRIDEDIFMTLNKELLYSITAIYKKNVLNRFYHYTKKVL
ncbi:hypothetical protein KJ708_00665, partial [bacterium]|nr:hypothetical protein [bacterium]MBU1916840.1 hypothetical protein [bacterium]